MEEELNYSKKMSRSRIDALIRQADKARMQVGGVTGHMTVQVGGVTGHMTVSLPTTNLLMDLSVC